MTFRFGRYGNYDIGGSSAVNQLVQAIEPADNGDRIDLRMDRQLTPAELRAGCLLMAGVYEANDHHPSFRGLAHLLQQPPCIATSADQDNSRPRECPACLRFFPPPTFLGILHELPPIHRPIAQNAAAFRASLRRGTIRGRHAIQRD